MQKISSSKSKRAHVQAGSEGDSTDEPAENFTIPLVQQEGSVSLELSEMRNVVPTGTQTTSHSASRRTFNDARDFNRLMSLRPGGVMAALQEDIVELGTIQSTDTTVNAVFGDRQIITKGNDSKKDPYYPMSWTELLKTEATLKDPDQLGGWDQRVNLTAYCLSIKDAAAPLGDGVLTPLLRREEKGVPTDKIWEFLSVRAIIQHKWDLWAAQCLFWESICFMGWLIAFVCFLLAYIEKDLTEDYDRMSPENRGATTISYIADVLSLVFMSPFLVKEFNAVVYYGWRRIRLWSIIDACCYILQLLISVFHFARFFFEGRVYTSLLAVHCVLLFVKVQYYFRVIQVGVAYVESLKALIIAVRGLLLFIALTVISAALAFATLYKWHDDESNKEVEIFSSFPRSIITTFAILLGNFDPAYVFHTDNRALKGIFFVVFQAVIGIAVLNLLIAVMTQSYAQILSRGRALHNRCRAQTIDLLEVTIPSIFQPKYKTYIHFLVREDRDECGNHLTKRGLRSKGGPSRESSEDQEGLKQIIKALDEKVDHLTYRINELSVRNFDYSRDHH